MIEQLLLCSPVNISTNIVAITAVIIRGADVHASPVSSQSSSEHDSPRKSSPDNGRNRTLAVRLPAQRKLRSSNPFCGQSSRNDAAMKQATSATAAVQPDASANSTTNAPVPLVALEGARYETSLP